MERSKGASRIRVAFVSLLLLGGAVAAVPPAPAMEGLPPAFGSDTLVALPSSSVPILDGVQEILWDGANELEVVAGGASGQFPPGGGILVRALHNFTHLFLVVSWPDLAADTGLGSWRLVDNSTPQGTWVPSGAGDDMLAILFDSGQGAEQNFSSTGCTATCHVSTNEMRTTSAGTLDLWQWSASLSNPLGIANDRYMDNATKAGGSATGGFHTDGSDPWTENNVTTAFGARPGFLNGSAPTSATFIHDADKQAINWTTFDSAALPNGTVVPGSVLAVPAGSQRDVQAAASHDGTRWTLEMSRPFDTGDASGHDVAISDLSHQYYFTMAVTDNQTGSAHSTPFVVQKLIIAENIDPDYLVRSAFPTPSDPTAGEIANVTVRVRNNGFANTSTTTALTIEDMSSAAEVARTAVSPVAWATDRVVFLNIPTAGYLPGVYNFSVIADADSALAESNESNNQFTITLTVLAAPAYPDLVLSNVSNVPAVAYVPQNITVTGTVTNIGGAPTGADVFVRASNDSFVAADANVGPLADGASANFTIDLSTASVAGGSYVISVAADPDDTIPEGTANAESNNTEVTVAVIDARPNLVASAVTLFPAAVLAGEVTEINVTLTNLGARAVGQVTVWTYLDNATSVGSTGRVLVWVATVDVGPGTFTHIATTWQVPPGLPVGTHSVRVWVDATGAFAEIDEGDNNRSTALVVLEEPRPDFIVSGAGMDRLTYRAGDLAVVTAQVTNVGANFTGTAIVEVYDSGTSTLLGSASVGPLATGVIQEVQISINIPSGTFGGHLLSVVVDPADMVAEGSELNNSRTAGYDLLPPLRADLTVGTLTASPPAPLTGATVQLRADVYNNGTAATTATDGAFRLGTALIAYVSVPALNPGSSTTVAYNWNSSAFTGLQALIVFEADVNDTVVELSDTNNTGSFTLAFERPGAPSFRLGALTRAPPIVDPGQQVRIEATLWNNGTAAGSARLRISVDGDIIFNESLQLDANSSSTRTVNWTANESGTRVVRAELLVGGQVLEASTSTIIVTVVIQETPSDSSWIWILVAVAAIAAAAFAFMKMRGKPPAPEGVKAPAAAPTKPTGKRD